MPSGNKPLPKLILSHIFVTIWRHWASMSYETFHHKSCLSSFILSAMFAAQSRSALDSVWLGDVICRHGFLSTLRHVMPRCLNQFLLFCQSLPCWYISKHLWKNWNIFFQASAFANVVCQMTAILLRPCIYWWLINNYVHSLRFSVNEDVL